MQQIFMKTADLATNEVAQRDATHLAVGYAGDIN